MPAPNFVEAAEAVVACDAQEVITAWNRAAEHLYGFTADEAIGRPFTLITPPGSGDDGGDFLLRLAAAGSDLCVSTKRQRRDGSLVDVELSVTAIRGREGGLRGFVCTARQRTANPSPPADVEFRYRAFINALPAAAYVLVSAEQSPLIGDLYVNRQFETLTGYPSGFWHRAGDFLAKVVHPEDRDHVLRRIRESKATGKPFQAEYRLVTKDGRVVWVRDRASLIQGDAGASRCWLGCMVDISDQKRTDAALAASQELFHAIFADAPIGMAIVSPDLHIVQANRAFCTLLGFAEPELAAKQVRYITHPDDLELDRLEIERALRGEIPAVQTEKRFIRKDGRIVWVLLGMSLVVDEAGASSYFIAQVQDITERRAAETEREATHQKIWDVLERITDGFVALDRAWRFTYVNRTAARLFDRNQHDLLGANIWEEFPYIRETALYAAALRAMTDGTITSYALFHEPTESWHDGRIYPSPGGLSLFVRDATEQRRAELATSDILNQLQQTNRELAQLNYAKSDFVSTISHEFRTPLTSIQGYSELLIDEELAPDQARAFAVTIHESAIRLTKMIGDVLDLDRMEAGQTEIRFEHTNLNEIVQEVVDTLRPTDPRHRFVLRLGPDVPLVLCDPDLMLRVMTNLVANAIKYAPMGGDIELCVTPAADGVHLSVSDQGLGVPDQYRESIFSRYGRIARPEQAAIEGTGLGLPIARHIVELHHGRIWVESNSPTGSVFYVYLPASQPEARLVREPI